MTSLEQVSKQTSSPTRSIVAIVSPKGGTGKTTLAANLAVVLARHNPTTLIDLDVYSGDVEWALGIRPDHRLDEVIRELHGESTPKLERLLHHHKDLAVICAPETPLEADALSSADILSAVDDFSALQRITILDTSPGVNELTLGAIERASKTILTTSIDLPSVRAGQKLLRTMEDFHLDRSKLVLAVMRTNIGAGLSTEEVEQMLGIPALLVISHDESLATSLSTGIPFVERFPDSKTGRRIADFATSLLGLPKASRRRFLSRVFG